MRATFPLRLGAAAAVAFGLFAVFLLAVRPWMRGWGATAEEQARPLPGDSIVLGADPSETETRAVTIAAPVEQVWPWLSQTGQDRGGFYSYELLENLAGCEMLNADVLLPDAQEWRPGDKLWMYPPHKLGGMGGADLAVLEPGRALGFSTRPPGASRSAPRGSWSFVLEPLGPRATRLLVRARATEPRGAWAAWDRLVLEPMHFAMERKMMLGLRDRAEGEPSSRGAEHLMVLLWTASFGLFAGALLLALRREHWLQALLAALLAGAAFEVLTLCQPSVLLGVPLVAGLAALVWRAARRPIDPRRGRLSGAGAQ